MSPSKKASGRELPVESVTGTEALYPGDVSDPLRSAVSHGR